MISYAPQYSEGTKEGSKLHISMTGLLYSFLDEGFLCKLQQTIPGLKQVFLMRLSISDSYSAIVIGKIH